VLEVEHPSKILHSSLWILPHSLRISTFHLYFAHSESSWVRLISSNLNFKVSTFHVDHEDSQVSLLPLSYFSLHNSSLASILADIWLLVQQKLISIIDRHPRTIVWSICMCWKSHKVLIQAGSIKLLEKLPGLSVFMYIISIPKFPFSLRSSNTLRMFLPWPQCRQEWRVHKFQCNKVHTHTHKHTHVLRMIEI
jgi:hypothetical protein